MTTQPLLETEDHLAARVELDRLAVRLKLEHAEQREKAKRRARKLELEHLASAWDVAAGAHELEPVQHFGLTPAAQVREHDREPQRRVTAGASRRGSARDSDPEPPAAACPGCGEQFTPRSRRQRYCTQPCRNAAKQRRHYARSVVTPAAGAKPPQREARSTGIGPPSLPAVTLRALANLLASERLYILEKLPSANGNTPELRARLLLLEQDIGRAWEAIRAAEAVSG